VRLDRLCALTSLAINFVLGASACGVDRVYADDRPSQKAVRHAKGFLDSAETGRYVLSFVHMGAQYDGNDDSGVRTVTRNGETVTGHFALVYDYSWEGDGNTQIAFLCDQRGDVYEVQILRTNAVLSQPYAVAKLSIDVLGNALLEAFKDNVSSSDRAQLQTMIRNADPKAILEMGLKLRQAFGR
jgi:hypothetical protein